MKVCIYYYADYPGHTVRGMRAYINCIFVPSLNKLGYETETHFSDRMIRSDEIEEFVRNADALLFHTGAENYAYVIETARKLKKPMAIITPSTGHYHKNREDDIDVLDMDKTEEIQKFLEGVKK